MRFHALKVSASVSGDYYQVYLGPEADEEDDPFEEAGPYLLLQREFEMSGKQCYVETKNESYIGHFSLKLIEFSRSLLSFDIVRRGTTTLRFHSRLMPRLSKMCAA